MNMNHNVKEKKRQQFLVALFITFLSIPPGTWRQRSCHLMASISTCIRLCSLEPDCFTLAVRMFVSTYSFDHHHYYPQYLNTICRQKIIPIIQYAFYTKIISYLLNVE